MHNCINSLLSKSPENVFIKTQKQSWTYKETIDEIKKNQKELKKWQLTPGDYLAISMEFNEETIFKFLAAIEYGLVVYLFDSKLPNGEVSCSLKNIHFTPLDSQTYKLSGNAFLLQSLPLSANIIIRTSGTTGRPKFIVHSHDNFFNNALASREMIPFSAQDTWLLNLPLNHVSGLSIIFRALQVQASIYLCKDMPLSFTDITHMSLVPTQLIRLLKRKEKFSIEHLKAILVGGSACPLWTINQSVKRKWPVFLTYGMSESASQLATIDAQTYLKNGHKYKILPFQQLKSENDEILFKGNSSFYGFVDPQTHVLRDVFDKQQWYRTGDRGIVEEDFVSVNGRIDFMFQTGGENIYPEEIEFYVKEIDGISEAIVIPLPDEEYIHKPALFYLNDISSNNDIVSIIQSKLENHLPKFKIPQYQTQLDEKYRNFNYKTLRKTLIKEFGNERI